MKEQQIEMIKNYVNAYNNFDIQGMLSNLSDNVVFENISNGQANLKIEGLKNFEEQAIAAKEYFEERKQTINSWETAGDKVMIGIAFKAVLAIDFPNGLKKGETLELKGRSEFEFENDKIITITDVQ